ALASSCRLILHDRRGTGLSSRNVAAPNLETRVSDLRLVLDEVGSECPVLGGINEAGAPNVMLPQPSHNVSARSFGWSLSHGWCGHRTSRGASGTTTWNARNARSISGAPTNTERPGQRRRRPLA